MSDELTPQAGAEEQADDQASSGVDEVTKLRNEAAKWRTKLRDTEKTLNELKPLAEQFRATQDAQKSEAQKMAEQMQALQAKLAQQEAAVTVAQRQLQLTKLATKAGVDLDVAGLLDLSKIDLDNEEEALKTLGKLAAARSTANSASNPGRNGAAGPSDDQLRGLYFGGGGRGKSTIFGG